MNNRKEQSGKITAIGPGVVLIIFTVFLVIAVTYMPDNSVQTNSNTVPKTTQISSKYKTTYQWECTKDVRHEQIDEYQILAIEDDKYNGIVLKSGKYKLSYTYKDYTSTLGLATTNKYNRFYFVYIANELGSMQDIIDEKIKYTHWLTFCPSVHDEEIVELKKGQYIYIEHTAIKEAGDGTIKLEKI